MNKKNGSRMSKSNIQGKKSTDLSEKYAESLRSFSITVMKKKTIQKTPMLEFPYKATLPRSKLQHKFFWKYD